MARLNRVPHCASAYHQMLCACDHARYVHEDEEGVCRERECDCINFALKPNYREMEHITLK